MVLEETSSQHRKKILQEVLILQEVVLQMIDQKNQFKSFDSTQKLVQQLKIIIPFRKRYQGLRYIEIPIPFVIEDKVIKNWEYCNKLANDIWNKFKLDAEVNPGFLVNAPQDDIVIVMPYPSNSWKMYYGLLIFLEEKHLPYRIVNTNGTVIARGGILND